MEDVLSFIGSHNRLRLTVSSVLGSTRDLSQLIELKSKVEGRSRPMNEVHASLVVLVRLLPNRRRLHPICTRRV